MCTSPVSVSQFGHKVYRPCGHCLECLKSYQDSWSNRLNEELKQWLPTPQNSAYYCATRSIDSPFVCAPPVVFFTLQYRESSVPKSYLNVFPAHGGQDSGVTLTDVPASAEVFKFYTTLDELNKGKWPARRRDMLRRFHSVLLYGHQDGSIPFKDVPDAALDVPDHGFVDGHTVPIYNSEYKFFPELFGPLSFEFNTVRKTDVQGWLKRCRMRLVREEPKVFGRDFNTRMRATWLDSDGNQVPFPSSALTPTFKYFITSEYGPQTHRPHMHGVIFGVTYDEFRKYFVPDWEEHFGHVDAKPFDPSRGAFSYVAKYCSKGGFEHPYCSKDFFYGVGTDKFSEYHSKDYEACIRDFGVNVPLVAPTFHLVSKGLGACYAFQSEVLSYFGVELAPQFTKTNKLRYSVLDSADVSVCPSVSLGVLEGVPDDASENGIYERYGFDSKRREEYVTLRLQWFPDGLKIQKFAGVNSYLQGESFLPVSSIVDCAQECAEVSKIYTRTYVKKSSRFIHSLPFASVPRSVAGCTTLPLFRYYRQWLISPIQNMLRKSFAYRTHPSPDEVKAAGFQQGRPFNAVASKIRQAEDYSAYRKRIHAKSLHEGAARFYNKPELCIDYD